MSSETVEQIKGKLDLVEFLKGYITITPAGRNFKANCPFHKEKTPSFMVSPDRGTWHCFGCGLGGDIFAFVMRHENIEFGEALKILADKAGVELRRTNPMEYKFFGMLYDINNVAKEFFRNQLEKNLVAENYLKDRGLEKETIHEFEIGFAPNSPDTLTLHMIQLGYAPEDLVRAGVILKTERGMYLDRFRGRIMFPIHNHLGKVVGFTGRVLPQFDTGEMGKYVNSPETPIFQKSKLLYGFWQSKQYIREANLAFLVEGQMDFLMSYQAGVKYAVASSGTALTVDHLKAIRRFADTLLVSFDNDEAGWAAGERAIDLAEANDFSVKVVTFGDEMKDPAEIVQKDPELLRKAVEEARPALRVYFDRYLSGDALNFTTREGLKRLRAVLQKIKLISSPAERSFWIGELSKFTGVDAKVLIEEADKLETKPLAATDSTPTEKDAKTMWAETRRELLSGQLIGIALARKDASLLDEAVAWMLPPYARMADLVRSGKDASHDEAIDRVFSLIGLQAVDVPDLEVKNIKEHLHGEYLKDRRRELTLAVKRAEAAGADPMPFLVELQKLPKQ